MKLFTIIAMFFISVSMKASITFMEALVIIESNQNCLAIGDNRKAFGCLQIHQSVITDVNCIYDCNYHVNDAMYYEKSIEICVKYLHHYGKVYRNKTGKKPNYEIFARIWNGGPNGYTKKSTEKYWKRVELVLETNK